MSTAQQIKILEARRYGLVRGALESVSWQVPDEIRSKIEFVICEADKLSNKIAALACERLADELDSKAGPTEIQKKYGLGITPGMHRKLEEHERRVKTE